MTTDSRIEELEVKCAFLERTVQELNDVLLAQRAELDRAARRLDELAQLVTAMQGAVDNPAPPPDPRAEIPPHY